VDDRIIHNFTGPYRIKNTKAAGSPHNHWMSEMERGTKSKQTI
jgi:hypothetical protein